MTTKSIFLSKTAWLNVIMIALAIITITDPAMLGVAPEQLLWISGVLNIFVRFLTTGAVNLTGGKES